MGKKKLVLLGLLLGLMVFALGVAGASAAITFNPDDKGSLVILSNNNISMSGTSSTWNNSLCRVTEGKTEGKWYWEVIPQYSGKTSIGILDNSTADIANTSALTTPIGYQLLNTGAIRSSAGDSSAGFTFTANDCIGMILDMDNKTLTYLKNNSSTETVTINLSSNMVQVYAACSAIQNVTPLTVNLTDESFRYSLSEVYSLPAGCQAYDNLVPSPIPDPPTNLTATVDNNLNKVTLNWTDVSGATSYNIKRSPTSGQEETVGASVYNSFEETLDPGTYYYVVSAVNTAGESSNSNEVMVVIGSLDGTLIITMENGADRAYNLTMAQIEAFINWYGNRATGGTIYSIDMPASGAYTSIKDYLVFDKIVAWKVMGY